MNKLTKLLSVFIIAGAVGAGVAGAVGCSKGGHSHKIDTTKWTDNEDGSTHDGFCNCGHLMVDDEEHVFVDGECIKCHAIEGAEAVTVTGVTVTAAGDVTSVAVDGTLQLSANVAGTGNPPQTVTWSSSDDGKATVSDNGLVTGVGEGQVTITATSTKDTSKSNTITLTVVAKGTLITIPDYAALVAQSDKLYNNDFGTAAARLPDFSGTYGGTRGVYTAFAVNSNTAGATNDTHYVKVEGGKAVQVNPGAGTAYTVVDFGAIKGDVEGYIDITLSEAANSMTFVQFIGDSSTKTNSEVFGLRTDGGAVKYRLDGGDPVATTPAISTVTQMAVYFRYLDGKMTVAINDTLLCKDLETTITKLSGFRLASGDGNTRTVNADNLVFCGEEMSAADYAIIALANLETEYAKYKLTGEGATHTTNGSFVTLAHGDGVTAINAANTVSGISAAYEAAVAAMKDVLADADIATAISAAEAALDEKFPSANYTYAFADGSADAIYNNQATYATQIAAIKGQIASGATKKSNLDAIVAAATISVGNNAAQLAAKKTAVTGNDGDIAVYMATETAAIETTYPTQYANIGDIKAQAVIDVNAATSIDAVNEIIAEAKADIDSELQATTETPEQTIARYQSLLEADGTTAKTGVTDADKIAAVDAAVTAGKAAIASATQANAGTVYDAEKAKVQTAIPKYEAKATLLTDKNDAVAEIHGDSTAATTATTAVTKAYTDGVEAIESATSTTAVDAALDTAQKAIAGAITTLKATKFTITVKKADGTTISNGLEIAYGNVLAIPDSKLTITDTEKLDKFYSKCEGNVLSEELTLSSVTVYKDMTVYASITEAKKLTINNAFSWAAIPADGKIKDTSLTATDITGVNTFLTLGSGAVNYRLSGDKDDNKNFIQVSGEVFKVTFQGTGTLKISGRGTGSSANAVFALQDENGVRCALASVPSNVTAYDNNAYNIKSSNHVTLTFNVTKPGTYSIVVLRNGETDPVFSNGEKVPETTTFGMGRISAIELHDEYKVDLDVSVTWGSGTAQKYYHDDVIALPEEPEGNGKFVGWYNKTTGDKFEGGKLAAGSYVFEAKFEYNVKITYKVNEDDEEGIPLYIYAEDSNDLLEQLPTLEPKDGNAHSGWTYADGTAIDFATIVIGTAAAPAEYNFAPVYSDPTSIKVASITVTAPEGATVEGVTKVVAGKTIQLTATVTPDNAYNKAVTWSCATEGVTISEDGLVTVDKTVAPGTITIVATAKDSEESETPVTGSITLTVEEAPVVTETTFFINDVKDAATKYASVAKDAKLESNDLFDITTDTAFEHYKGTDTGRAKFTPNDGKERAMLNGSVIKMSTYIPYDSKSSEATNGTAQFMTIKANAKIELKVYLALSNGSWGDNSTGNLTYKIKQADGTYKDTAGNTAYSFASRNVTTVTIVLEKDEELELTVAGITKTSRFIYFGGAEATVVKENN